MAADDSTKESGGEALGAWFEVDDGVDDLGLVEFEEEGEGLWDWAAADAAEGGPDVFPMEKRGGKNVRFAMGEEV